MEIISPKPLQQGDTVGFVSPSSRLLASRLKPGIEYFENKGFKVKLGNHLMDSNTFLAGKDEDRAKDIIDFFRDPEIKAIIATIGGHGSQRLLSLLDYTIIRTHPKIFGGFSDTTALQLGIMKKTGLISYTGFTLQDTERGSPDPLVDQTFMSFLNGDPYTIKEGTAVCPGVVEGPLVGGTLSLIISLMGTPYQPDFRGKILLLEEVGFEPFLVDSMLSQLHLAGVFDQVSGIVIGQFVNCIARHYPDPEIGGTIENVINEWASRIRVPCLKDFPYGHGSRRCVLPIGQTALLDVNNISISIP